MCQLGEPATGLVPHNCNLPLWAGQVVVALTPLRLAAAWQTVGCFQAMLKRVLFAFLFSCKGAHNQWCVWSVLHLIDNDCV